MRNVPIYENHFDMLLSGISKRPFIKILDLLEAYQPSG
jgi:hypothetical protein